MPSVEQAKIKKRREMRDRLARLTVEQVDRDSRDLRRQLSFPAGSQVALFAGTSREPMLLDLIPQFPEIHWFLPKVTAPGTMVFVHLAHLGNLRPGAYGIPAPPDGPEASSLDAILCPGLAFTRDGRRLGQGGGYYDRILPRFPQARLIGMAFRCQIVEDLPWESHDCRMDAVLTPRRES